MHRVPTRPEVTPTAWGMTPTRARAGHPLQISASLPVRFQPEPLQLQFTTSPMEIGNGAHKGKDLRWSRRYPALQPLVPSRPVTGCHATASPSEVVNAWTARMARR